MWDLRSLGPECQVTQFSLELPLGPEHSSSIYGSLRASIDIEILRTSRVFLVCGAEAFMLIRN